MKQRILNFRELPIKIEMSRYEIPRKNGLSFQEEFQFDQG